MKPFGVITHVGRAREIFTVLARHGFADLLDQLEPSDAWWRRLVPQRRGPQRPKWERTRLALEELGPTFVKAGQILSMRPDMLPQPLILELRKLQSHVAALPFSAMREVITTELEADIGEVFGEFNETPIASASIAQVYLAKLLDGREVAVKVQRPNLQKPVEEDLELLAWLAAQAHQRIASLQPYNVPSAVEEVRQGMLRELDFLNEVRNMRFFNAVNTMPDRVYAPWVAEHLCTRRVLVMERIGGEPITSVKIAPELRRRIARNGAESLMHQVLIGGFFHADPHAGNLLVTPDGRLCFLDWGLAGHLTRRLRYALADLFQAALGQDAERIVQITSALGDPDGGIDYRGMERDITLALRESFNSSLGHEEIGQAILKVLHVLGRNGINMTRDYSLMAKAVLSIEEAARTLDPGFELRTAARPVIVALKKERASPRALWKSTVQMFHSITNGVQELPAELYRIVRRVGRDDFSIKLQHRGLEDIDDAMKTAANRITLGVVIGSLIVGSSMMMTTQVRPYLFGYPALGVVGYLISAMLGLYVIWDIIRHGRHK
ncbi:AarF/UbiB family protein [Termitidicoccus mucosus]|uniref:ABC transporter n=1 Tax=Termitidicoccus mucosus TaxID=1184151 RepID=A0A178IE81_9BACT|nr:ABC transporter [Opitutaceae bacterium TSB47]